MRNTLPEKKNKEKTEFYNERVIDYVRTENPLERLSFRKYRKKKKTHLSFNFYLFILVVLLLGASIFLNNIFLEKLDPKLFKITLTSASFIKDIFTSSQNFVIGQLEKPYVLTIGEYGNFSIAKEEAFKLLPKFKQIHIGQLDSGVYTFKIGRFTSKKKAYFAAEEFIKEGFDAVHVRYLLN